MVQSSALSVFLSYVENPTEPAYETIQARRECARILAALAKHNVQALVNTLKNNSMDIEVFAGKVDSISDVKLRNQATLLRDRLRDCIKQQLAAGK